MTLYTLLVHVGAVDVASAQFDAVVFLLIGLLGSAHCLGMCGPLVNVYADELRTESGHLTVTHVRQHTLFNLGRAGAYALLGATFAFVGRTFFSAFDPLVVVSTGVRAASGVVVGALIMATGAYYLLGKSAALHRLTPSVLSSLFGRVTGTITGRVESLARGPGIVALGGLHGLLPCPLTYPAYLYAFALGDPLRAALLLGLLGLGSMPSLFVYGTFMQSLSVSRRAQLHRVLGVAFVALGYVPLSHGLMLVGVSLPHPAIPYYQPLG